MFPTESSLLLLSSFSGSSSLLHIHFAPIRDASIDFVCPNHLKCVISTWFMLHFYTLSYCTFTNFILFYYAGHLNRWFHSFLRTLILFYLWKLLKFLYSSSLAADIIFSFTPSHPTFTTCSKTTQVFVFFHLLLVTVIWFTLTYFTQFDYVLNCLLCSSEKNIVGKSWMNNFCTLPINMSLNFC